MPAGGAALARGGIDAIAMRQPRSSRAAPVWPARSYLLHRRKRFFATTGPLIAVFALRVDGAGQEDGHPRQLGAG
jgi:hypothetical protein